MPFTKTEVHISIDGSAFNNGQPDATAGYGIVVELNDAVAEIKSALCSTCDFNMQTNNRAELRAAQSALNFLHELAKLGRHKDCRAIADRRRVRQVGGPANYLSDGRSIDACDILGIIRTDSTFVLNGATGVNRQLRHKDLWTDVNNCMNCVTKAGMDIRFEHVRGHTGDWANERADDLAREMAARAMEETSDGHFPKEACCISCRNEFADISDLAVHFKEIHMGRDVGFESIFGAMEKGAKTGLYECTMCDRELGSGYALRQHLRDKHSYA